MTWSKQSWTGLLRKLKLLYIFQNMKSFNIANAISVLPHFVCLFFTCLVDQFVFNILPVSSLLK